MGSRSDVEQTEVPRRPADLGRRLALSSGGITAVIARLEADGWITRRPHPTDGRSILVALDGGDHVKPAAQLYAPLTHALDRLAAAVPPEQLAAAIELLERAADVTARQAERLCRDAPVRSAPGGARPGLWA